MHALEQWYLDSHFGTHMTERPTHRYAHRNIFCMYHRNFQKVVTLKSQSTCSWLHACTRTMVLGLAFWYPHDRYAHDMTYVAQGDCGINSSGKLSIWLASKTASPCSPPAMTAWYSAPCGLMYLENAHRHIRTHRIESPIY